MLLNGTNKQVFDKLLDQLSGMEFVEFFDKGSTARVYHVRLPVGPGMDEQIDRIVKVFRTRTEMNYGIDLNKVFQSEVSNLIKMSHTNVISLYSAGYLEYSGEKLPYYIMEFLPGARDLDEWIESREKSLTREVIIQLLIQAARGIEALHMKMIYHCDLKFGNMLVGESGQLKIADLGFAKQPSVKPGITGVRTTDKYYPKCYEKYLVDRKDKRQMLAELPRELVNSKFDLHYFGQVVQDIINITVVKILLSESDRKGFRLLIDRLNLDCKSASLPHYKNMGQVIADLEKMQTLYLNRAGVEELSTYTGTRTLRIPVTGNIPFTERVAKMIHHPTFFRLNNAHQLGFTYYVFPGSTHTRLEHSLGVFSNVSRYINSLLADDHQPYFRQLIDEEMIVTALLAGLLHDIGQHSYAHSLEDVGLSNKHEKVAKMFITGEGMEESFQLPEYKEPLEDIIKQWWPEVDMKQLCWLITGEREDGQVVTLGWEIIRAILNGPIDADKTDYLLRDAHHAGVEYARSIDITRFMNSLSASLIKDDGYTKGVLAITWKGSQSAENIVLARSQMFWVLYWHHAVRSAHAMLAHACASHLQTLSTYDEKRVYNDVLYWGTIGEFIAYLQLSRSPRAKNLAKWLRMRRLFKRCISLNYENDKDLYDSLLRKKSSCEAGDDKLLTKLNVKIAEKINEADVLQGAIKSLSGDDIIIDIPKADKDKLGTIYVVEKGCDSATPYTSRGLLGNFDDWQNRVRTIRVFVDPKIDATDRQRISMQGRSILAQISGGS